MELTLTRLIRTDFTTIGRLTGLGEYDTLEDVDRGLHSEMTLDEIEAIKVDRKTAIPAGRYEVKITDSVRFKRPMPQLMNVPGFGGIRIHVGNYAGDTEGCLLLGKCHSKDFIGNSRDAFGAFFEKLKAVKEKVYITIK